MLEKVVEDNFRISAQQLDPGIVLVTIAGDLDMQTVPRVTASLAHTNALSARHLILDLTGVTFLSSSGLGLLIAVQSGHDGTPQRQLHLVGVTGNRPVERPLVLIGMLDQFNTATDLDALLARLHTTAPLTDY
jgi:anti-anti-sigma factor